jgi:hypothetical protein
MTGFSFPVVVEPKKPGSRQGRRASFLFINLISPLTVISAKYRKRP